MSRKTQLKRQKQAKKKKINPDHINPEHWTVRICKEMCQSDRVRKYMEKRNV